MAPTLHSHSRVEHLFAALQSYIATHTREGALVCMPTGSTPRPLYQRVRGCHDSRQLWRTFRYVQLDEYIDAPAGTEPFSETLRRELLEPLQIPETQRFLIPPIDASNVLPVAQQMDRTLATEGPLDLVVLGLGRNGHIAFNEPISAVDFPAGYHQVQLSENTLQSNFPGCPKSQTTRALTISVPQICAARRVCLVVPQPDKQDILERSLAAAPTPRLPASALAQHVALDVFRVPR